MLSGLGVYAPAQRSASELLEYDRRITEFDARRPPTKAQYQTRIISWSDPVTARGLLDEDTADSPVSGHRKRPFGMSPLRGDGLEDAVDEGAAYQTFEGNVTSELGGVAFGILLCTRAYSKCKLGMYLSHS